MEGLPQARLNRSFGAVVIGASAGGIAALGTIAAGAGRRSRSHGSHTYRLDLTLFAKELTDA